MLTRRLLLAVAISTLVLACASPGDPVQWPVSEGGNGHWYEILDDGSASLSWNSADALAQAQTYLGIGGQLASIASAAENQFIINNLLATDEHRSLFIGAIRANVSSPWQWTDGEAWGFTYWDPGSWVSPAEPHNDPEDTVIAIFSTADCAVPWASGADTLGGWNDIPPDSVYSNYGYIVEYAGAVGPQPDIEFQPAGGVDFDLQPANSVTTQNLFIRNVGTAPLIISDIYGLGTPFSFESLPTLPLTIAADDFITVAVRFEPPAETWYVGAIHVVSNDPDHSSAEVPVQGTGREATPAEQIEQIQNFFADSVKNGTLQGEGKGNSGGNNLEEFRMQLENVLALLGSEPWWKTYEKLGVLYKQCDGQSSPKDKVVGPAASHLAQKIKHLMDDILRNAPRTIIIEGPSNVSPLEGFSFQGTVLNQDGEGVAGVQIYVEDPIRQVCAMGPVTDAQGVFRYPEPDGTELHAPFPDIFSFKFYGGSADVAGIKMVFCGMNFGGIPLPSGVVSVDALTQMDPPTSLFEDLVVPADQFMNDVDYAKQVQMGSIEGTINYERYQNGIALIEQANRESLWWGFENELFHSPWSVVVLGVEGITCAAGVATVPAHGGYGAVWACAPLGATLGQAGAMALVDVFEAKGGIDENTADTLRGASKIVFGITKLVLPTPSGKVEALAQYGKYIKVLAALMEGSFIITNAENGQINLTIRDSADLGIDGAIVIVAVTTELP